MNADFTALYNQVITLTKRPDLVEETIQAIQSATLRAHQLDYFPRDLIEAQLNFASPAYYQELDLYALFPRFRALRYLRKLDSGEVTENQIFTVITPEKVVDSYGLSRTNVCYLAGTKINIKSSTEDSHMLIGYYVTPDITQDNYNSWVATTHPFVIVYGAVLSIFMTIGFQENANMFTRLLAEASQQLINTNVLATGY